MTFGTIMKKTTKQFLQADGDEHGDVAPRRARLNDIAKRCGVSVSTVSRALSGEKGVSQELRQSVQEVARALRYAVPIEIGGSKVVLATSREAMVDYSRSQFTWYVLEGLKKRAEMMGIEIIIEPIADTGIARIVELERDASVSGVIFLTVDDPQILDAAAKFAKPVVLVNSDDPQMRLSSVLPCNRSAARLATDYLLQEGHRKIAFLMCPGRRTIEQRLDGWREAYMQHGMPAPDALIIAVNDWLPELAEQAILERVRANRNAFSAVLCAGDSLAIGAIRGLLSLGYRVPDDYSVMGMDDLPFTEYMDPPLTTIHLPVNEMGSTALELLQEMISGNIALPRRIELACALAERQSVRHGESHEG